YGKLGRIADAESVRKKLDPLLQASDEINFTWLLAINYLPYKNFADMDRFLDGLRKSGVPELAYGYSPKSEMRLTASELKTLFWGHELRGRWINGDDSFSQITTAEGQTNVTMGSAWSGQGSVFIYGNYLCKVFTTHPIICSAIFRNPSGNPRNSNEYI